jgi:hypothetical protein
MDKLETPLTWALVILILGYFIAGNCCKVQSNDQTNNGFSWSTTDSEVQVEVKIITDTDINVDSIIDAVLAEVDSVLEVSDLEMVEKKVVIIKTIEE